jgi:uncharacterized membrane protein YgdD (TMEM256/DUF423 family)
MSDRGPIIGAVVMALAVAAGAFGAHGLRSMIDARGLELWETAARYLVIGAVGLLATGLARGSGARSAAVVLLCLGTAIFSGTVMALALGGPRILGAVTPIGGLGMIAGFLALALALRIPNP